MSRACPRGARNARGSRLPNRSGSPLRCARHRRTGARSPATPLPPAPRPAKERQLPLTPEGRPPRRKAPASPPRNPEARSCGFELFAEERLVQGLGILMAGARLDQPRAQTFDRLGARGFRRFEPSVEDQARELALFVFDAAQDRTSFADDQFEHRNLFVEQLQYLVFDGSARGQIEDEDLARLPYPVQTADALFN